MFVTLRWMGLISTDFVMIQHMVMWMRINNARMSRDTVEEGEKEEAVHVPAGPERMLVRWQVGRQGETQGLEVGIAWKL